MKREANPLDQALSGSQRETLGRLARSGDARKLMELLNRQGGVQEAAQAAAGGDTRALMEMMDRLMRSGEGAALVERIGEQARKAGLEP